MASETPEEWVYVGSLPDTIEGGHPIAPGEQFTRTADSAQEQLLEEAGRIIPAPIDKPLGELKVAQLRAVAESRGVEIPNGAKKDDIIALLEVDPTPDDTDLESEKGSDA